MLIGVLTSRVPGRDGMKGVRVGEASNPGQDDQLDPTADDSMEVLSALEFDLTQLDSDVVSGSDCESTDREDVRAQPIIGSDT